MKSRFLFNWEFSNPYKLELLGNFFGTLPKCESLAGVRWAQCNEKDAVAPP